MCGLVVGALLGPEGTGDRFSRPGPSGVLYRYAHACVWVGWGWVQVVVGRTLRTAQWTRASSDSVVTEFV